MQQIQWQDRFNIGVETIDQAHHRLFSIVQKMMDLYVEKHEDKFACVEGIKYFKAYALKHFAEEEAYMQEIGYPGYRAHKRLHDKMRWETLPALEHLLYDSNFSTKAVQRFIGVCTGWLTGHIIIEDRAITGKAAGRPAPVAPEDERAAIHATIISPLQELLGCSVQFAGVYSTKDTIADAQYYELTYSAPDGSGLRVILVIGEQMLLHAAGLIFDIDFYERNETVSFAMQEIAQNLIQRAAASFGEAPDEYQLAGDRFLTREEFDGICGEHAPQHSLLFQVNHACFALCLDQLPPPAASIS